MASHFSQMASTFQFIAIHPYLFHTNKDERYHIVLKASNVIPVFDKLSVLVLKKVIEVVVAAASLNLPTSVD